LLFTLFSGAADRVDWPELAAIEANGVMNIANERRAAVNIADRLRAKAGADLFMNFYVITASRVKVPGL
jgi:poly-gamma-glutamate capsule biosynthesis protein CapA/YwtB (metallophosphatase superfamily)